jgi:hypothetical protein
MNKNIFTPRFFFITIAILLAAMTRFLPHPPNFVPITAIALFGGAFFSNKKLAFLIPFAAMIISDLYLGFHSTIWAVYLSFALIVIMGLRLQENKKVLPVVGTVLASSVLFFIITNFAVWLGSPFYEQSLSGLIYCYGLALPFFNYSLLADVFYSTVLFGGFILAEKRILILKKA